MEEVAQRFSWWGNLFCVFSRIIHEKSSKEDDPT